MSKFHFWSRRLGPTRLRAVCVGAAGGIVVFTLCGMAGAGTPTFPNEDALSGWKHLAAAFESYRGKARSQFHSLTKDASARSADSAAAFQFKKNNNKLVNQRDVLGDDGAVKARSAMLVNDEYSASVASDAGEPKWRIQSMQKQRDAQLSRVLQETGFLAFMEAPWKIVGVPLSQIVAPKYFTLRDFQVSGAGPESRAVVKFDYANPSPGDKQPRKIAGTMELLPARDWCLKSYDVTVELDVGRPELFVLNGQMEIQYADNEQRVTPTLVSFKRMSPDGAQGVQQTYQIDEVAFDRVPDDEFRLAAFGLGDSGSAQVESTGWSPTLWIVANALVIIIIVALMIRRRQRQTEAAR